MIKHNGNAGASTKYNPVTNEDISVLRNSFRTGSLVCAVFYWAACVSYICIVIVYNVSSLVDIFRFRVTTNKINHPADKFLPTTSSVGEVDWLDMYVVFNAISGVLFFLQYSKVRIAGLDLDQSDNYVRYRIRTIFWIEYTLTGAVSVAVVMNAMLKSDLGLMVFTSSVWSVSTIAIAISDYQHKKSTGTDDSSLAPFIGGLLVRLMVWIFLASWLGENWSDLNAYIFGEFFTFIGTDFIISFILMIFVERNMSCTQPDGCVVGGSCTCNCTCETTFFVYGLSFAYKQIITCLLIAASNNGNFINVTV